MPGRFEEQLGEPSLKFKESHCITAGREVGLREAQLQEQDIDLPCRVL